MPFIVEMTNERAVQEFQYLVKRTMSQYAQR